MLFLGLVQTLSVIGGIFAATLTLVFRRFGPASWLLSIFLLLGASSAGSLACATFFGGWPLATAARLSFSLLVAAAPLGLMASYTIDREYYLKYLRERRYSTGFILLASIVLIISLYRLASPVPASLQLPAGHVLLGPGGAPSAFFLLLVSVIVLANLEQTIRSAQEHIRWEIKFLLLGLAATFGAILYVSSKVLLYSPRHGILPLTSLQLFPILFLFSCFLILVSWHRSSGHSQVVVSHRAIYSSITLFGVGIYLIASGLAASWAGQWETLGFPVEAIVFLLAVIALAVCLLWADFRHRIKLWIRRNLLAGSYDYRLYWLEATERVRFIDRLEDSTAALMDIVQHSLGAIDVSLWMRLRHPNRLKLLDARGTIADTLPPEWEGLVDRLMNEEDIIAVNEMDSADNSGAITDFSARTRASLLVPLQSSGRLVGLLTVGPDRSGSPYSWGAREFLGVLGKHGAAELHKADLLSTLVQAKETEAFRTFSTFLLHDLKNFSSTLSLIAKNASRHQDNPDFQRDAFRSVFEIAERMKNLCNSLRIFSTSMATHRKMHDLCQIARTIADSYSGDLGDRLILDLGDVPPVFVDGEEIARVLQNLILNAREAIAPEGSIILRTRSRNGMVELSVEDNGRGMTPEFLEQELFLPFHTTKSDGLGIGLFQSKKIVEAHKGTIRVESAQGKGTIVRVLFPVAQA
jgi:putative PEP-CTERM system histidine kinase